MKQIKIIFLIGLFLQSSCKKENDYIYQLQDVNVKQTGSEKNNSKSTTEFISIAYSDLFSVSISQSDLLKFNTVYTAFGDKKLIEDRIIRNLLNTPGVLIPTGIGSDTTSFINNSYKKFYNREPNAFESYYLKQQIRLNTIINPTVIYYCLMTSDEYRYY